MGLTCASIHLFSGGLETPPVEADVDRLLGESCRRLGYELADQASGEIQLAGIQGPFWITVLDGDNPGIITESLSDLAKELSVRAPVLLVSVYDSDEFSFLLYEKGKQVDGFSTNPTFVPFKFKKWSAKKRVSEWTRAFAKPIALEEIQELTQQQGPFADEMLQRLCLMVGLPLEQGAIVFKDLQAGSMPARHWYFHRKAGLGGAMIQIGGQEGFQETTPKTMNLLVGESKPLAFEISVAKAALANPILEISGSAIDQGLVEVDVSGLWHCGLEHVKAGGARRFQTQQTSLESEGRRLLRMSSLAMFPELDKAPKSQITLAYWVGVRSLSRGEGELRFTFRPQAEGVDCLLLGPKYLVQVMVPRWVPLGCAVNQGARMLNTPTVLSGIAIVEEQGQESYDRIRLLLETWLTSREGKTPYLLQTAWEGQMKDVGLMDVRVPKRKSKMPLAEIKDSKKWLKLFQNYEDLQSLFVQIIEEGSTLPFAGAAVQRELAEPEAPARSTIQISFWCKCPADDPLAANLSEVREQLTRLIDSILTNLIGIQGWVAQWDWIPRFSTADDYETTPYEDARSHSRNRHTFMSHAYCNRNLRGLSDRLWLGAALFSLVPRERLAEVVHMTTIGSTSVRLDLLDGVEMRLLEAILAPILPASTS